MSLCVVASVIMPASSVTSAIMPLYGVTSVIMLAFGTVAVCMAHRRINAPVSVSIKYVRGC